MSPQSNSFLAERAVALAALGKCVLPASVWHGAWPVAKQWAVNSGVNSSVGHCGGTEVNSLENTAFQIKRKTAIYSSSCLCWQIGLTI